VLLYYYYPLTFIIYFRKPDYADVDAAHSTASPTDEIISLSKSGVLLVFHLTANLILDFESIHIILAKGLTVMKIVNNSELIDNTR